MLRMADRRAQESIRRLRGQSTVEFVLMLPVVLAVFFFVIEMSLYFTTVHYVNYGTYVIARSKEVGYRGNGTSRTAAEVAEWILSGSVLVDNYDLHESSNGITVELRSWRTTFPYLSGIMPDAKFQATINLGPDERSYESKAFDGCADNDLSSNPC